MGKPDKMNNQGFADENIKNERSQSRETKVERRVDEGDSGGAETNGGLKSERSNKTKQE